MKIVSFFFKYLYKTIIMGSLRFLLIFCLTLGPLLLESVSANPFDLSSLDPLNLFSGSDDNGVDDIKDDLLKAKKFDKSKDKFSANLDASTANSFAVDKNIHIPDPITGSKGLDADLALAGADSFTLSKSKGDRPHVVDPVIILPAPRVSTLPSSNRRIFGGPPVVSQFSPLSGRQPLIIQSVPASQQQAQAQAQSQVQSQSDSDSQLQAQSQAQAQSQVQSQSQPEIILLEPAAQPEPIYHFVAPPPPPPHPEPFHHGPPPPHHPPKYEHGINVHDIGSRPNHY